MNIIINVIQNACYGQYTDSNTNCKSCISNEKYLNYGNCINNCSRSFYINKTNNQRTCKCEIEQCLTCSMESLNRSLCTLCDEESGFYPIYDLNNILSIPKLFYFIRRLLF